MLGGPDPAVASQQPCKLAVPTAITPPPCLASPPRRYANQIKRCDEMARQLRFFTSEVEKAGILVAPRLSSEQVCGDFGIADDAWHKVRHVAVQRPLLHLAWHPCCCTRPLTRANCLTLWFLLPRARWSLTRWRRAWPSWRASCWS